MFSRLEALKHRIHNFRMPIRNQKLLFAVKCCYFVTPIILGHLLMQAVIPDPEEMRQRMGSPSEQTLEVVQSQREGLQQFLAHAEAQQLPQFLAHADAQHQRACTAAPPVSQR